MSRARRSWSWALVGLLAGAGCVTGSGGPASTTPTDPPATVPGAEVFVDSWQVPHVYASTREGIARGYGWAQMRAYPEEILRLYAVARGRGAEVWGQRYRPSDRMVRTLSIPQRADEAFASASPGLRAHLTAFAQGMNDYAAAHPERIPELAREVLPVRATDALAHSHRMLLSFTLVSGQRPIVLSIDGETMPWVAGSNVWAIGPSRSASGNPLLLANPHLPWGPDALRVFEAHLVGPDAPLYGVTMIGFPLVLMGFNDAIAWSHTINVIDGVDFYRLVPEGEGYRLDDEVRAFETRDESILVRQEDDTLAPEEFVVRRSVHGPVVELADGQLLAMRSAMDDDYGGWAEAWLEVGRARDLPSFEAVLQTMRLPMFTVGYADRDGHIFYLSNGKIPRRPSGEFSTWLQPVPGDRSELIWDSLLPYEALPRVVDPKSGFLQNSNSGPWFATLPSPFDEADQVMPLPPGDPLSFREIRSLSMLAADPSITFEELGQMRQSSYLQLTDHVLDDLTLAAQLHPDWFVRHAGEVLSRWDRQAQADSRGTVLFEQWVHRTLGTSAGRLAHPWSPDDPLRTPQGLADSAGAVRTLEATAYDMRRRFGSVDVPWGEVARLRDDLPGVGASGGVVGSFHAIEYRPTAQGDARPVGGDTFVAIVEMTPHGPHAEVLLTYGNASPDAPFAADQFDLVADGTMRRPLLERSEVLGDTVESVVLEPSAVTEPETP